jgi:hypothetical protein
MSKTVTFDHPTWPGEVTFASPMSIELEAKWEYAVADMQRSARMAGNGASAQALAILPGIFACVEKWSLKGLPERITLSTFPNRPRAEREKLIAWLVTNISEIYGAEQEVPNV